MFERRVGIVWFLEDDEWRRGRHGERWRLDVGEAEGRWHGPSDEVLSNKAEVEGRAGKVSETESRSGARPPVEFSFDSSALGRIYPRYPWSRDSGGQNAS